MAETIRIMNEDYGTLEEYDIEVTKKPTSIKSLIHWYTTKDNFISTDFIEDMTIDQLKLLALQAVSEKYEEVLKNETVKCSRGYFSCTESDIVYISALIDKMKESERNKKIYLPTLQLANGDCYVSKFDEKKCSSEVDLDELEFIKSRILEKYLMIKHFKLTDLQWIKEETDKDQLLNGELAYSVNRTVLLSI